MLIYYGTLVAMAVLVALCSIWGRRQQALALRYRNEVETLRGNLIRSANYGRQWREEAQRLRQIVDRVEN